MLPMILASLLFLICLGVILSERLNRTIAGLVGAVLMVILGLALRFYTEEAAAAAIDFNTIGLLLGMMVLIALLEPTGFFQYLAIWMGRFSKGRPVLLLVLMGLLTSVVSMFLDNVTTVVLIAPITLVICEILGLSPQPYLISEAILSNTGGIATLVGDPPNVLIASAANLSFLDFLTHSLPLIFFVWLIALGLLRWLFRAQLPACAPNEDAIYELDPREALTDLGTAIKTLVVIAGAVLFFFLQEPLHIRPSLVGLAAAAVALAWIQPPVQETLKRIQWDVLIFFAALFIMVGGLEASGALSQVAYLITQARGLPPVFLGLIILWVVAILSAVVDNIPITIALIPIIQDLDRAGIPVLPLWWALVFGAGLGGNGTIIGSTANVVVASLSEKTRVPITSKLWNRRGLPVMFATCVAASLLYIVFFGLFQKP
jgi:Na+/H+ antiporter NhaD/arsenite permease-like protein